MSIALVVDFNALENFWPGPEMSITTADVDADADADADDDADDAVAFTTADADADDDVAFGAAVADAGAISTSLARARRAISCSSCHRAISLLHVVLT